MQKLANLKFTVKSYTYLGKYLASIFNQASVFLPISLASNYVPILIKKMKNIAIYSGKFKKDSPLIHNSKYRASARVGKRQKLQPIYAYT